MRVDIQGINKTSPGPTKHCVATHLDTTEARWETLHINNLDQLKQLHEELGQYIKYVEEGN